MKKIRILLLLSLITLPSLSFAVELTKGYLLLVSLETYEISKFGAISKEEEAKIIFENLKKYGDKLGIAYLPLYFSEKDIDIHKKIAKLAFDYKIDLWLSSYSLIKRIRAFGQIKNEFQAYCMSDDGKIIPAFIEGKPLFDVLNPDAVDWFIEKYKEKYLIPMKGLYRGYIFDEDVLPFLGNRKNGDFFDYRKLPTFSDKVLHLWKEYCLKNDIKYNGKVVDKFPVDRPDMEKYGDGKTQFYEGYHVPKRLIYGQKFKDLPKSIGVWEHWFNFVNQLFIKNWIEKIAKVVREINNDNKNFYGVGYLSFFEWNLPYEYLEEDDFIVTKSLWGAWGKQRYADITMIAKSNFIDFIICETYPPLDNIVHKYLTFYKKVTYKFNKLYGIQLHRDDKWKIDIKEEIKRWDIIKEICPNIIVRYPLKGILPDYAYYSLETENLFRDKLNEYMKKCFQNKDGNL